MERKREYDVLTTTLLVLQRATEPTHEAVQERIARGRSPSAAASVLAAPHWVDQSGRWDVYGSAEGNRAPPPHM